jgi:hypothetical protein
MAGSEIAVCSPRLLFPLPLRVTYAPTLTHATEKTARMKKIITMALVATATAAAFVLSGCEVEDTSSDGGGSSGTISSDTDAGTSKPKYTVAQSNAIKSAKSYLSMGSGFSRAGLINQLSSQAGEGYKRRDAVFAVNHIKVNYNRQAAISAKSYMEMGGMSRSGLIQQLTSKAGEQYTPAQAEYAAKQVGY